MAVEFKRLFTRTQGSAYATVQWRERAVPGWSTPVEAPEQWSETAVEIAATKYFRRRGVTGHAQGETSVRQLVHRVVRTIREAGEWQGYFDGDHAQAFEDELAYVLLHQLGSFNSPVYFNVGVFARYGVMGSGENYVHEQSAPLASAYVRPQASACFIQDVKDDLIGIFDLLKSEAKLFKYGSGTGTNFSRLRGKGEILEGGGESTGLISYLEIFDKAAQAIKSGGTTRRAAKMVVVDADHPEVRDFIQWKMLEERKARVLLANGYSGGMEGEAFRTISGQNSNNSVRLTDEFLKRATEGGEWELRARKGGDVTATMPARDLLKEIARAAWECADPGVQYHDAIQRAHLCPSAGEIRSSNPCSEYLFLDDSACNLASLNLVAFIKGNELDWPRFEQAARLLLTAQEILVDYASYPTKRIADNSHRYRPLGLGYANLGGMLMRLGVAYDSDEGRAWTARVTAAMHAVALDESSRLAEFKGAFEGWAADRAHAIKVLEAHAEAWSRKDWIAETFQGAIARAKKTGLRNAQVTLLAPTGTIGLFMDCDTLGIEPDFALIKRKTLAGGGELRLVNRSVAPALTRLGYEAGAIQKILEQVERTGTVVGLVKPEHEKVFDTAVPPKGHPQRAISPDGHLKIMAAAQPFLSGAISKTVNLPHSATPEDVENVFLEGWRLGLKAVAIYRDGSKSLQPLCAEC